MYGRCANPQDTVPTHNLKVYARQTPRFLSIRYSCAYTITLYVPRKVFPFRQQVPTVPPIQYFVRARIPQTERDHLLDPRSVIRMRCGCTYCYGLLLRTIITRVWRVKQKIIRLVYRVFGKFSIHRFSVTQFSLSIRGVFNFVFFRTIRLLCFFENILKFVCAKIRPRRINNSLYVLIFDDNIKKKTRVSIVKCYNTNSGTKLVLIYQLLPYESKYISVYTFEHQLKIKTVD